MRRAFAGDSTGLQPIPLREVPFGPLKRLLAHDPSERIERLERWRLSSIPESQHPGDRAIHTIADAIFTMPYR